MEITQSLLFVHTKIISSILLICVSGLHVQGHTVSIIQAFIWEVVRVYEWKMCWELWYVERARQKEREKEIERERESIVFRQRSGV